MLKWTNKDWMRTYAALHELINFYDLEHNKQMHPKGNNTRHFHTQTVEINELLRKLEYMFSDDSTSEESEVQSGAVSRDGSVTGESTVLIVQSGQEAHRICNISPERT